jgi:hypothetical protein
VTAPKRQHQPDPFIRAVDRYAKRGWDLPCDCPCHWWPDVDHSPCCPSSGMRYIASEGTYLPWADEDEGQ